MLTVTVSGQPTARFGSPLLCLIKHLALKRFGIKTALRSRGERQAASVCHRSNTMTKRFLKALILLLPVLAFAQSSSTPSTYQPATITAVKPLDSGDNSNANDVLYEVSVKVGGTVYVVLTPSPSPSGSIMYVVGRQLLVHVNHDTITWSDIMGQTYKAPIISRIPISDASKPQS